MTHLFTTSIGPLLHLPHAALIGLRDQIREIMARRGYVDPVANPTLLRHLTSYASIVAGQPLQCRWGDGHYTDLINTIVLNPFDPKDASAVDRKIIVDAALEHEVRGHWLHTPRSVFEAVCEMAEGKGLVARQASWQQPARASIRHAIKPIFNILEDGRVETRLRWEHPGAYKVIATSDRIRPRWVRPPVYLAAPKTYAGLRRKASDRAPAVCSICQKNETIQGVPCQICFTEQYRWEQISGMLLLAALPPHTPPVGNVVEGEVYHAYHLCSPWILRAISGTAQQAFESAQEILRILIDFGMVPPTPETKHLMVSDAKGSSLAQNDGMTTSVAEAAGFKSVDPTRDDSAKLSIDDVALKDLQDFDFGADLDMDTVRAQALVDLDAIETELQIDAARCLVLSASGLEAGEGVDTNVQRTARHPDIYAALKQANVHYGYRFAREIQVILATVARPELFQRRGRMDRSQLVNAAARGKETVFSRTRIYPRFNLAISLLVDVSGSMAAFNQPFAGTNNALSASRKSIQLADAVTICAIGLERLGAAYEVRAFGSYHWLAKGFYDQRNDGLGGLPGLDKGGTDMLPAILYARLALLGRRESSQIMVIMTDGYPGNPDKTAEQIRLARSQGIRVLGVLFANGAELRNAIDPAMAKLFGPSGYTAIHGLAAFPHEVGRAIKAMIRERAGMNTTQ